METKALLSLVGTLILFLMAFVAINQLFARTHTSKVETVRDVIEKAEKGIASSIVYSPGLDLKVETYVCGPKGCREEGIKISDNSTQQLKKGRVYVVSGRLCGELVCITVMEGGNRG